MGTPRGFKRFVRSHSGRSSVRRRSKCRERVGRFHLQHTASAAGRRGGGLRDERPDVAATGNIPERRPERLPACLQFVRITSLGSEGGAAACVMSTRNY